MLSWQTNTSKKKEEEENQGKEEEDKEEEEKKNYKQKYHDQIQQLQQTGKLHPMSYR